MSSPAAPRKSQPKIATYAPRPLRARPVWRHEGWLLKPYEISHLSGSDGGPEIPAPLREAARQEALTHLRVAAETAPSYGAGFVVLHRSVQGAWLFCGWWAHDNILCSGLSHAPDTKAPFAAYDGPIRACVHELAVVEYERRIWIETMMSGQPDLDLWAGKRLTDPRC